MLLWFLRNEYLNVRKLTKKKFYFFYYGKEIFQNFNIFHIQSDQKEHILFITEGQGS